MEHLIRISQRTLSLVAAAACVAATAAACTTSGGTAKPTTSPSTISATAPAPAVSKSAALALIRHYTLVNNKANTNANSRLLDTVEDGPLYEMSLGEYKQGSGTPAKDRTAYKPWSYDTSTAHLYIPRFTAGAPRWFAAALTVTGDKTLVMVVFEQQPTGQWEMVQATDLDSAVPPRVALDHDGYATAVPVDNTAAATADADHLRQAVIDDFATGGKQAGARYLASSSASRRQIAARTRETAVGKHATVDFTGLQTELASTAYGLRTTSGGTLVLFAHSHVETETADLGWEIDPGTASRAWLGIAPRQAINTTFLCTDAALAPASGRATLLGYRCQMTDVQGPTSAGFPNGV
ncbi:hypothetical protein [Actinacidiphila sp. bgisy144]|uniref:hypothetical protein n=1 Tax=Actinacidiphila sp. bgisy144 TaxID=3413791 RepID=UPI003EBFD52A